MYISLQHIHKQPTAHCIVTHNGFIAAHQRSCGKVMLSQVCVILSGGGGGIITGRNEVVANIIFLHLSFILFTGGVCLSACWDTTPGSSHPPPGADTTWSRHPPGSRHPPPQTRYTPRTKYSLLGLSTSPGTKYTPWD